MPDTSSVSLLSMSSRSASLRRWLATVFEDEEPRGAATRAFNLGLTLLIVVNVSCVVLETVEPIRRHFAPAFNAFEGIATAIFAVEYGLRVWACVDFHQSDYRHPVWGRIRYVRSFFALVDLVAVLPAILGFFDAADFRVLRLLRLLRMLKLVRHSTTFGLLFSVLREEARSIAALLFVLILTVVIAGSLMYMLESAGQPDVFSSIPAAMWWAIETLTTVGYGDMVPMTAIGRVVGGAVSVIGIGTLALFSGLITVGFLDQLKLYRERHPKSAASVSIALAHNMSAQGDGQLAANRGAPAAYCPHCGAHLSHSVNRHTDFGESLGT